LNSSIRRNPEPQKPNWTQEQKGDSKERFINIEIPEKLFYEIKYCPTNSPAAIKNVFETLKAWISELELIPAIGSEEASEGESSDCEETQ